MDKLISFGGSGGTRLNGGPRIRTVCQAVGPLHIDDLGDVAWEGKCQHYAMIRYFRTHDGPPYDYCAEHGQEIERGIGSNPALRQLWGRQYKIPDK